MRAIDLATNDLLPAWLEAADPDIILMHLGTYDTWDCANHYRDILAAYSVLLSQMRQKNPEVVLFVAQIIPNAKDNCDSHIEDLNGMIPGWAKLNSTPQSPVFVVDQYTGFDPAVDTVDGTIPNDSGDQKIAKRWLEAIKAAYTQTRP